MDVAAASWRSSCLPPTLVGAIRAAKAAETAKAQRRLTAALAAKQEAMATALRAKQAEMTKALANAEARRQAEAKIAADRLQQLARRVELLELFTREI